MDVQVRGERPHIKMWPDGDDVLFQWEAVDGPRFEKWESDGEYTLEEVVRDVLTRFRDDTGR